MASRRQAFQSNPELQQFLIPDVRPTGKQLGVGSYGSVEELEMNGLVCAGKRLHDALLQRDNAGVANIERKYIEECQVMAKMRHPHIVQFLGLCYLEGSALPVVVMERLDSSLDDLLEGAPGLPLTLKRSLLADVARGLLYLHTRNPPVVHRDLSARNVLLTSSLAAKISDLGNARIVNLQPGQLARTLTHLPGTMVYMPPEAFEEGSRYGPRLDIFSFGHLALFTLTQVFPGTLLPHNYEDPRNPDCLLARSEVERRRDYIQPLHGQLGEEHPLVQLVHQCLRNTPARRPSAEDLLQQLEAVRAQIEGPYGRLVNVNLDMEKVRLLREKDTEIRRLQQQMQQLEVEMEAKDAQLRQKDDQLQQKDDQLQQKDDQLQQKDDQLQQKDDQLQQKDAQLQHKDDQIQRQATELRERTLRQQRELQTLREDKGRFQAGVEAKNAEIDRQQKELQTLKSQKDEQLAVVQAQLQQLQAEMDARSAQVQQQLRQRDAEINRLRRELRDQTASSAESVAATRSPPQKSQTHLLSELTWRRLPDMPRVMWRPQSVTVDTAVYIADRNSDVILRYDPHTDEWTKLPQYQYWRFTLTELTHQLVVVGGIKSVDLLTNKPVKTVSVYAPSQRSWKQPYPPMNTPRYWPAVSTYHQRLVVAGGGDDSWTDPATVETLDTSVSHSQWLSTTGLPVRCRRMSAAITHGTLYLIGGTLGKKVLSVSLSALTQTDKPPAQWRTLPDTPLEGSAAIAVHGSLLAVGGSHGRQRSSAIHVYDQEKNTWKKVGDLPTERQDCACCLLPSGEILVAGGLDRNGNWTSRMDVAAVKD